MPGYAAVADQDRIGDDIAQASSVSDAATRCNADDNCKGFNSGGWYKRSVTPTSYSNGVCLYTKIGGESRLQRELCSQVYLWGACVRAGVRACVHVCVCVCVGGGGGGNCTSMNCDVVLLAYYITCHLSSRRFAYLLHRHARLCRGC